MSTFLKIVHLCIILIYFSSTKATIVNIPQGSLVGLKLTSILHNKTYYSFKGIPYAEPRTGEQKFDVGIFFNIFIKIDSIVVK